MFGQTRITLVVATLLVVGPRVALRAQATTGTRVDYEGGNLLYCADVSACHYVDPGGNATVTTFAAAVLGGPLRVSATIDAADYTAPQCVAHPTTCFNGFSTYTFAQFDDTWTVAGAPAGSSARIFASLSGTADATFAAGSGGYSNLQFDMTYGNDPMQCFLCNRTGFNSRSTNVSGVVNDDYVLSFAAINGTFGVEMGLFLSQEFGGGTSISGDLSADFSHTALFTGLEFVDAGGDDITDQVTITSANNIVLPLGAPVITPEAPPIMLVGLGLALLFGIRFLVRGHDQTRMNAA